MIRYFIQRYRMYFGLGVIILISLLGMLYFYDQRDISKNAPFQIKEDNSSVKLKTMNPSNGAHHEKQWVVDVKGAVYHPGVYYFKHPPLVQTVLDRAGGCNGKVDQRRINLAAKVQDGQVIYVPEGQEAIPSEYPLPGMDQMKVNDNNESTPDKIDLNHAGISDLEQIPGIGPKRAAEIIAYRDKKQGFKNLKELQEISGIGEKTYMKLSERLYI